MYNEVLIPQQYESIVNICANDVQVLLSCPSSTTAVPGAWERTLQKVLQMSILKNISQPPAATHVL